MLETLERRRKYICVILSDKYTLKMVVIMNKHDLMQYAILIPIKLCNYNYEV